MRELTAALVADGQVPSSLALAPDGRRVAYVVADELWLAGVGLAPRALCTGGRPRWSADGESIFFLSGGQLHRRSGDVAEPLTAWPGGIEDHVPLADGRRVALIARDSTRRDDPWVWSENTRPARLRILDLTSREVATPDAPADVIEVCERPGGGPLALLTSPAPEDIGAIHVLTEDAVEYLGPAGIDASSLIWWEGDDGWHVAFLAKPALVGGCAVFDLGPDGARRDLTYGATVCPVELVPGPLVLVAAGLDTAVCLLDLTEVARMAGHAESLTASGDTFAAVVSTRYEPKNVYIGHTKVTDHRPELREIEWGVQERLSYRASDGLDLDGLLIRPTTGTAPFPLITVPHGGPYGRFADRLMLDWVPFGQWLATWGYAVFLPNPRGSQGHGHAFAARVAGAVGREEWTDILTGLDLLIDDGIADPGRLAIAGWSHGGYLAAWAVARSDRFKAALVGAGISDWGMLAATGEWGPFEAALGGSAGWEGPGPHPHDRGSPISYAADIRTPVLIVHGARDTNVPVSQAEFLHRALRRFGVEHEYVVYPREGHAIRERDHRIDLLHRTRAWFDRWLKPPD